MTSRKVLLLGFLSVLCFAAVPSFGYTKPAYGKTAELLQEWKQKLKQIQIDLQIYKERLIESEDRLRALQTKLATLQMELEVSSRELTTSRESSANLLNSLNTLKASLAAEALRVRNQKIWIGILSALGGAALGVALAFIILAAMGS